MSRLLIALFCLATIARAEIPGVVLRQSEIIDIALSEAGTLISRCQDEHGQNVAGAPVTLSRERRVIAQTVSGPEGWFALPAVPAGVYELRSTGWQNLVRVWTADAAPPAAGDPIVLVLKPPELMTTDPSLQQVAATAETTAGTSAAVSQPLPGDPATAEPAENADGPMFLPETESTPPAIVSIADADPQVNVGPRPEMSQSPSDPASADDAAFSPFDTAMSMEEDAPLPPGAPLDPAQVSPPDSAVPLPPGSAEPVAPDCLPLAAGPPAYVYGPTVGDVVTTAAGVAGLTVGVVALYKYDRRSERVRVIVSP